MEFVFAIMMYMGLMSPEMSGSMTDAEMNYLINSNYAIIEDVVNQSQDPQAGAALQFIIDRKED